jgi:hypothetical protein
MFYDIDNRVACPSTPSSAPTVPSSTNRSFKTFYFLIESYAK